MPTITIELTEEQAACLWADNWETGDVSEVARKILKSSAEKYSSSYPGDIPDTITRYREFHQDIPSSQSAIENPQPVLHSPSGDVGSSIPTPPLLEIQPGDIILVESPEPLNKDTTTIQKKTKALFPGHKVVIFSHGLHLTAVRPASLPSEASAEDGSAPSNPWDALPS